MDYFQGSLNFSYEHQFWFSSSFALRKMGRISAAMKRNEMGRGTSKDHGYGKVVALTEKWENCVPQRRENSLPGGLFIAVIEVNVTSFFNLPRVSDNYLLLSPSPALLHLVKEGNVYPHSRILLLAMTTPRGTQRIPDFLENKSGREQLTLKIGFHLGAKQ